jgi:hypothetical protein
LRAADELRGADEGGGFYRDTSEAPRARSQFQHDPAIDTELEIRFSPEGASTRVDLEHRLLHYYGDKAVEMRGIFDSEQGWMGLLNAFAARASAS